MFMNRSIMHTDNKPKAFGFKKASVHLNLAKRIIELQNYSVKIKFLEGKRNKVADALSRVEDLETGSVEHGELNDLINFPRCLTAGCSVVSGC